jgi:methionyl-tRNA formyltransferase
MKTHVILAGYRDWALNAFSRIESIADSAGWDLTFQVVKTEHALALACDALHEGDRQNTLVFLAGWSWIVPAAVVDEIVCVGVHPSDLPAYAGGSPIQHQVGDGITHTKATLFRLRTQLDGGEIVCKASLSLEGHMTDIFVALERATTQLFVQYWTAAEAGTLTFTPQVGRTPPRRRFRPEYSLIPRSTLASASCRELWNVIRCREDPYPNAYLEDETGRLVLARVEFQPAR